MAVGKRIGITGLACCPLLALAASPALAKGGKLGPVVTRTATVATPSAPAVLNPVSATATCPGKKRAVGGGWSTSTIVPADFVIVYASLRASKKSWVNNAVGYPGQTLTTYVYCRKLAKAPVDVAVTTTTTPGAYVSGTTAATCPGKRKLLSGGFSSDQGPTGFDFAVPNTSINRAGIWIYSATNNSPLPHVLTSHAYCAKGIKAPKLETGSNSSGSEPTGGSVSSSSSTCSSRKLSAGGFSGTAPNATGVTPYPIKSQIDGSAWTATVLNSGVAGPIALEVQGICF